MDIMQAMRERHSVRQYAFVPLSEELKQKISERVEQINEQSGLHIQLVTNEPKAFSGFMAHYGHFSGVSSYLALIGKKGRDLEERCGYYGEMLVLYLQQLGLNTCWTALTYKKIPEVLRIEKGEQLVIVIALGKGKTQGQPHRSKSLEEVSEYAGQMPEWFRNGVEAALLAPTAVNQQRFFFAGFGPVVAATDRKSVCSKIDLGIVKYHFELGAGKDCFHWA